MGRSTSTIHRVLALRGYARLLALPAVLAAGGGTVGPAQAPPDSFRDVIYAQGLLRLGDPDGALAAAEPRLDGESALWAHRVVQDALIGLGRGDEARQRYLGAAEQTPDSALFAYLAGRILLPDGDAARPHFEAAIELDPDLAWGHIGLAHLEVLRGDMFQAIMMHRTQLDRLPGDPDLQMSLGFLCLDLRLLRDAQRAFRVALDSRPWDPRILGGLGQTLGQLDRGTESLDLLRRSLEVDPSRTDLMGAEAYVLFREGRHEDAWDALVRQNEVDGSVDPVLGARLASRLDRSLPQVAPLGPVHLQLGAEDR